MQRVGGSSPRSRPGGGWPRAGAAFAPPLRRGALELRGAPAGRRGTSCMRVGLSARGGRWLPPSWTPGLPAVRGGAAAARHSLPDPSGGPSRTSRAWEAPPPAVLSEPESQIVLLAEFPNGSPLGPFKNKYFYPEKNTDRGSVRQAVEGGLWMLSLLSTPPPGGEILPGASPAVVCHQGPGCHLDTRLLFI